MMKSRRPTVYRATRLSGLVAAMLVSLAFAPGCWPEEASAGGDHSHGGHAHGASGGGHDHGDEHGSAAHRKLVYASGYELFVEYPPLVAGEEATFSAHVTALDGYEPADEGSVAVVLTSDAAPGERFEVDAPVRGGLYRPVATPEHAETRRLFVTYRGPEGRARFSLGEVEVHESAPEHPPHEESPEGIAFSKEQQWKVDFSTGTARLRSLRPSVPAQGVVRPAPDATARLRAPFAGRLLEPNGGLPDVGASVEAGETLAVIAPTVDANALPMLRADLSKAKTRRKREQRRVERLKRLVEKGAIPKSRLLNAQSDLQAASADVEAAREQIDQYRSFDRGGRGATVYLRAPVDGAVAERPVTGGEYVEPGDTILRTIDEDRLRLEARVAEANLPRIGRVDGVWFRDDAETVVELERTKESFFARIDRIDPETRTSSIWFGLPDDHETLAAGQFHRVHLRTGEARERLAVPASALLEEKGVWTAYVVRGGETFERRRVRIGIRDGAHVEIVDGLEPGDRVVTRGAFYVKLASATTGVGSHSH